MLIHPRRYGQETPDRPALLFIRLINHTTQGLSPRECFRVGEANGVSPAFDQGVGIIM